MLISETLFDVEAYFWTVVKIYVSFQAMSLVYIKILLLGKFWFGLIKIQIKDDKLKKSIFVQLEFVGEKPI